MTPRPRVLIVDDVPESVMLLGRALGSDYDIQFATSGQQALQLIGQRPPDLVLLDMVMPEMDGLQVLRRLRESVHAADVPVIMISADDSEQSQLDGLDTGADDYLGKPVLASVLRARVRNLLQRRKAEQQLRLADHVFRHCGEAIMVTDRDNCIIEVNPSFTRLTGYSAEEVIGLNPRILSSGRTSREQYQAMWTAISHEGFWQGEIWDRHKSGHAYPKLLTISVVRNRDACVEYYIATFTDISERKAAEERIEFLAHHDPLTGLPNRLLLTFSLEHALSRARRDGQQLALLLIDLDRFKEINDSLGHPVGDGLLIEVAARLSQVVRQSDLVARLGGDEFVLLLNDSNGNAAANVAQKLLDSLERPYEISGHVLRTTGSIGISLYPEDGDNSESLMCNADLALYEAKARGRNNFQFFHSDLNRITHERQLIESRLHMAVEQRRLQLHFQPQINAQGRVVAVEALSRWHDPELGQVAPDRFIPVAEDTGLILRLGEWVLDTACATLRSWRDAGVADVRMAINLSLVQLRQLDIVAVVQAALQRHGLQGQDLELEITETTAMHNPQATLTMLHQLRELGVQLAIDDFGTGYSSLSSLKLLPIQRIKLDRSFVANIAQDVNDTAICAASIAMAHAMGLEVVAEGVETQIQRGHLLGLGCDLMQGYLFSMPLPAGQLLELLQPPAVALPPAAQPAVPGV